MYGFLDSSTAITVEEVEARDRTEPLPEEILEEELHVIYKCIFRYSSAKVTVKELVKKPNRATG